MGWENLKINWPDNSDKIDREKPEAEKDFVKSGEGSINEDEVEEKFDPREADLNDERQRQKADEILKARDKTSEKPRPVAFKKSTAEPRPIVAKELAEKPSTIRRKPLDYQKLLEKVYGGDQDVMSDIDPSRKINPSRSRKRN